MLEIMVRYHGEHVRRLEKTPVGDWLDLASAEDVTLKAGEYRALSLGVSMRLPEGYEAHIAPRSSTFQRYGILQTNGVGVVDNAYSGDGDVWRMPVYATRDTVIRAGDRICQFRLMPVMPPVTLTEVARLPDKDRGGLGSTGR